MFKEGTIKPRRAFLTYTRDFQRARRGELIMSDVKRSLFYAGLILATLPVAACNTVEGAGKDVKAVGNAVEEGAEEVGEEAGDAVN
jgi:predicted small secreted protein